MTREIPDILNQHSWDDATPDHSILIVDGPTAKIYVKSDRIANSSRLCITDGPDGNRERFVDKVPAKGEPKVSRLIILAGSTSLTGQAEKWMADNEIQWAHIEYASARVRVLGSSEGFRNPKLLRRQADLGIGRPDHALGLVINRGLIAEKIRGQAWNAEHILHNPEAAKKISAWIDELPFKGDVESIRGVEGNAAHEYWQAWKGLRIKWAGKDKPFNPRWQGFNERDTLVHKSETNKDATDPVNAQLNYLYGVAESICTHAIIAAGLEPTLGISHADQVGRDSFALDLMEVLRPWADEIVLRHILTKTYKAEWFTTTDKKVHGVIKHGIVSCKAPLTHELASALHQHTSKLQPAMQFVTKALAA